MRATTLLREVQLRHLHLACQCRPLVLRLRRLDLEWPEPRQLPQAGCRCLLLEIRLPPVAGACPDLLPPPGAAWARGWEPGWAK